MWVINANLYLLIKHIRLGWIWANDPAAIEAVSFICHWGFHTKCKDNSIYRLLSASHIYVEQFRNKTVHRLNIGLASVCFLDGSPDLESPGTPVHFAPTPHLPCHGDPCRLVCIRMLRHHVTSSSFLIAVATSVAWRDSCCPFHFSIFRLFSRCWLSPSTSSL